MLIFNLLLDKHTFFEALKLLLSHPNTMTHLCLIFSGAVSSCDTSPSVMYHVFTLFFLSKCLAGCLLDHSLFPCCCTSADCTAKVDLNQIRANSKYEILNNDIPQLATAWSWHGCAALLHQLVVRVLRFSKRLNLRGCWTKSDVQRGQM